MKKLYYVVKAPYHCMGGTAITERIAGRYTSKGDAERMCPRDPLGRDLYWVGFDWVESFTPYESQIITSKQHKTQEQND